jgi:hypothetical protein
MIFSIFESCFKFKFECFLKDNECSKLCLEDLFLFIIGIIFAECEGFPDSPCNVPI